MAESLAQLQMTKVVGPEFWTKTPRISARNAGQPFLRFGFAANRFSERSACALSLSHIRLRRYNRPHEPLDPFILMLLAQSFEKTGDLERAKEYYRRVMANNGHGPTNAFARPVARKKLTGG
jgi:hypothetical protein